MGQRVVDIARALLGGGAAGGDLGVAARAAVARAPLPDALICLSLGGDAGWLEAPEASAAAARVDLLIWEAGAGALSLPELGAWLWSDAAAQQRLLHRRIRGALRERSLAARLLAIAADGLPADLPARAGDELTRMAAALAAHPEPMVWIPAVRALGRLAARAPGVRLLLHRWTEGTRPWERRRAVTALASAPPKVAWIDEHADAVLADGDLWRAAAIGPAIPHLVRERPALWAALADKLLDRAAPEIAWSTVQGLASQVRGGPADPAGDRVLRVLRDRALSVRPRSVADAQLWQVVRRDTDHLDGIDPDPSFPDVLLDRAVRDAARVGAAQLLMRTASLARGIGATFAAQRTSAGDDVDQRAHTLAAAESCTRAAALALWQPIIAAAGRVDAALDGELDGVRDAMGRALAATLAAPDQDFASRRGALRGLGNLVDAAAPAGPRGRAAAFALAALAEAGWARDRDEQRRYRKPVTDLLWRVGDALRDRPGGDEARVVGPLAAWWALSAGGLELLDLVEHESAEAQARVVGAVAALRDACNAGAAGASAASVATDLLRAVDDLGAGGTALYEATRLLLVALDSAEVAQRARLQDEMAWALTQLAEPVSWLSRLRGDPAAALAPPGPSPTIERELMAATEQAVATGTPTAAQAAAVWTARVGPLLRPALAAAVTAAVDVRRAAVAAATVDDRIGPYRKLRRLGSGGHGEVWLVRRDGARRFVLKVPLRARELADDERAAFAGVLEREASLLESLHEAKVASFIDYGWDGDLPYLVLEYLVGVDLQRYTQTRALTVAELKPIVRDVCIGLRALHGRNIVHRDLKPSNVFLRLQLPPGAGEEFSDRLREPAVAPVSEAVLIDFGVARLMRDGSSTDAPEGTLGYLSPEQAQAADDITAASDVYGLAATVYTALTNQRFFADRPNKTACLVAHAFERPLEDREIKKVARALPRALRALLDEATSVDPARRPDVARFAARFDAL